MLIHEYIVYKIWESDLQERELQLSRSVEWNIAKVTPARSIVWGNLKAMFTSLIR